MKPDKKALLMALWRADVAAIAEGKHPFIQEADTFGVRAPKPVRDRLGLSARRRRLIKLSDETRFTARVMKRLSDAPAKLLHVDIAWIFGCSRQWVSAMVCLARDMEKEGLK